MKRLIISMFFLLFVCKFALAETMYVTDLREISVRHSPSMGSGSATSVQSGSMIEVLKTEGDWSYVKTQKGIEGYVLTRYLTHQKSARAELEALKKKYEEVTQQSGSKFEENKKLQEELSKIRLELNEKQKNFDDLNKAYIALKNETPESHRKLKTEYEEMVQKLSEQTAKAESLERRVKSFYLDENTRWFLSGAGVLLLGIVLGFSVRRQRKKYF